MEGNGQGTEGPVKEIRIKTLEDLIGLNLSTLEAVVNGTIDNRKAQLIFTGSRTATGTFKLGIDAMKLGMTQIGGVSMGQATKYIAGNGGDKKAAKLALIEILQKEVAEAEAEEVQ